MLAFCQVNVLNEYDDDDDVYVRQNVACAKNWVGYVKPSCQSI